MTFAARTVGGYLNIGAAISDQTAENQSLSGIGGTASATYRLASSGLAYATNAAGTLTVITGEWLLYGAVASYEAQGTWGAGSGTTSGPTGWNSLSVTRDWSLTATNSIKTRTLFVEIRQASTAVVIATATITFDVDSAP